MRPASMGPQPFGCGRARLVASGPQRSTASMGPQPFGCGRLDAGGFVDRRLRNASMGPQPFGCGRLRSYGGQDARPRASMGPQPFGCGRDKSTTTTTATQTLQWGRNLSVAEGGAATPQKKAVGSASMGPQPFGCGRELNEPKEPGAWSASMGPQPFGCGRPPARAPATPIITGFNGAATFRLRKVEQSQVSLQLRRLLQWGRNLSVAEGPVGIFLGCGRCHASMGPQPFGCGRPNDMVVIAPRAPLQWGRNLSVAEGPRPNAPCASAPARFNGAATFRLRKELCGAVARDVRGASMGPQPFGCGRHNEQAV